MTEAEAVQLFKCLGDRSRLQILKSLAQEDMDVERLAGRLGLSESTVCFHLKKLEQARAVSGRKEQYYRVYALNRELFRPSMLELLEERSDQAELQERREEAYRRQVVAAFLSGGRLKTIPAQRKKRRIILEELARAFAYDRAYPEREVNLILSEYHEDFCTLRREMVGERLLARENGVYWRLPPEPEEKGGA